MTIAQIREAAVVWAERLGIGHWTLDFRRGSQRDMNARADEFLYARIVMYTDRDGASIIMFRPNDLAVAERRLGIDLRDGKSLDRLCEESLIHELLHIRLDPREKLATDAAFENGLDALASLLYVKYRGEE